MNIFKSNLMPIAQVESKLRVTRRVEGDYNYPSRIGIFDVWKKKILWQNYFFSSLCLHFWEKIIWLIINQMIFNSSYKYFV